MLSVIVSENQRISLEEFIPLKNFLKRIKYELIFVSNVSANKAIAENLGAHFIFQPEKNISKSKNTAAMFTKGSHLLFIDKEFLNRIDLVKKLLENSSKYKLTSFVKSKNKIFSYLFKEGNEQILLISKKDFDDIKGFEPREKISIFQKAKKALKRSEIKIIWN